MDKKMIELTTREAVLLSIAVRGFGGSYVKMKNEAVTKEEKKKYDRYIDECIALALKLELAFGVVERKITTSDGSETVCPGPAPRKKKN